MCMKTINQVQLLIKRWQSNFDNATKVWRNQSITWVTQRVGNGLWTGGPRRATPVYMGDPVRILAQLLSLWSISHQYTAILEKVGRIEFDEHMLNTRL